jgi:hypothetical protein
MNITDSPAETPRRAPQALGAEYGGANCNKVARPDWSYIDRNAQENTVVLSDRLRELIAQVGGCQTAHVEAVIRRVMYEVLQSIKY